MNLRKQRSDQPRRSTASRDTVSPQTAVRSGQYGAVTAEDVLRVLGNPLGGVEVQSSPHASFAGKIAR
jgi:hypothetical protein